MFEFDNLETEDPSPSPDDLLREEACRSGEKLNDKMFNVRRDACRALAGVGQFAEPYLQLLKDLSEKDEDLDVRKAARTAVRELRDMGVVLKPKEVPQVPGLSAEELEQHQVWATRAGRQLGDKMWNVRRDACKRLGTVGTCAEPYLPRIQELAANDENESVRKAAETALKKLKEAGIFVLQSAIGEPVPADLAESSVVPGDARGVQPDWSQGAAASALGEPGELADLLAQPGIWGGTDVARAEAPLSGTEAAQPLILPEPQRPEWREPGACPQRQEPRPDLDDVWREAAQAAAEELADANASIRRDACKTFGGLGKYAEPYLPALHGVCDKDASRAVRIAAKSALQELREDGVGLDAIEEQASQQHSAAPAKEVLTVASSPNWTGPIAKFQIFEEVLPMELEREGLSPAEIIKVWERWGVCGVSRVRFHVPQQDGEEEAADVKWLNPREDIVPLSPTVVKLEARVGSVLSALAVALHQRIGEEDIYRKERMNRRRDPRSKLWIEGPALLGRK
mmetsp:Transcript_80359/g.260342  ORF Transcript_80359/g.260342 Transcript_80359/m.260342 type:complete len:513 (+) Transcript_80359:76-1614(+)